ncbi:hypothetical protein N657DRAFT_657811 [Parathielavia appendiculata]|uniref:Uncharacterized protein n=1 Tax=Parathielavia appendiculata TaxID=2587402 RepID=A0AAN6Z0T5_9PEZI|nr:hypothetical protein N657DRAFT_657811 [Parathielavia appendiculata]
MKIVWILAALAAAACCNAESISENEAWEVIRANKDNDTALHTIYAPPWTYVLTLFAFIYTALHLNVPAKTDFLSLLVTRTKWVIMALIPPGTFDFNLRYAFFVVMGEAKFTDRAFRREHSPEPGRYLELAKRDCWVYIKRERIAAKSKANVLQKALVLLQVSYTAATCVNRRAYGPPITSLELHTMVHVICAVAMYKPLDVSEAELVYDAEWDKVLAVLIQRWKYRQAPDIFYIRPSLQNDERLGNWQFWIPNTDPKGLAVWNAVVAGFDAQWGRGTVEIKTGPMSNGTGLTKLVNLQGFPVIECLSEAGDLGLSYFNAFLDIEMMLIAVQQTAFLVLLAVAFAAVYGGVHLSASSFEFPTAVECLQWKIMWFIIIGVIPAMVGTMAITWEDRIPINLISACYMTLEIVIRAAYGCARLYIVPTGLYYTPPRLLMVPHA